MEEDWLSGEYLPQEKRTRRCSSDFQPDPECQSRLEEQKLGEH